MRQSHRGVTIYDVAKRAGVSISTVSLAINSPHRVREVTRARVLTAAGALGYRTQTSPRPSGAGIRIAVAAPFSSYPTYLRRLTGMFTRARDTAIEIITHDLESAAQSAAPLLDTLPTRGGIDGLIVMGVPLSSAALRASRESQLPIVLVDVRTTRRASSPSVVLVDDLEGGRAIGRHLHEHGHRQAIFLHEPQISGDYLSAAMMRASGIQEFIDVVDAICPPSAAPGKIASAALLARPSATAVVAHHDDLALRIWHHFHTVNGDREHDPALVGYDDSTAAEVIGLTTVRQPFEESGAAAMELLLDEIAGSGMHPHEVTLAPELIVRSSTSDVPQPDFS